MGELKFFRDIFETKRFMEKLKGIKFISFVISHHIEPIFLTKNFLWFYPIA